MPVATKDIPADLPLEALLERRERLNAERSAIITAPPPQDHAELYRLGVYGGVLNWRIRIAVSNREHEAKQKVLRSQEKERARLESRRKRVRDDRAAARAEHEQAGATLLEPFNQAEEQIAEAEAALAQEVEQAAQAAAQAGAPKRAAWPSRFRRGGSEQ
jgi:septal ring factor EnvC (AmiA/AmiB activator)